MDGESWEEYTESINLNLTNKANFLAKIEYTEKDTESSTGNDTTNKRKTINKPISYIETLGITFSSITWQDKKASIEILANNKENIEYQINDNTTEANWQKGYNVNNLNHNDILYARIKEGSELIDEASIKIEDIIPPTVEIEVTKINAKNITVNITKAQDDQTGIGNYTYVVEINNNKIEKTNILEATYKIEGLEPETNYTVYAIAYDNAGNYSESNKLKITTLSKEKPGESGYEGGAYNDPYIPIGFKHIGEDDWNSGYTIIGETVSVGNEFVWVPCVLTEEEQQQAQNNGNTVQIFQKKLDYPKSPGLEVTGDIEEANYIATSVGTYQGFYIAKYEAGIPETTQSVTENHNTSVTGNILPVSKPNVGVWNFISRTNALSLSNKMINYEETGAHSTLISGAAWDTTLQWITNTIDASYAEDSTDKGNYTGTIEVTSSNNNTVYSKNNIYDMAGNVSEWTTENCTQRGVSWIVGRGRKLQF